MARTHNQINLLALIKFLQFISSEQLLSQYTGWVAWSFCPQFPFYSLWAHNTPGWLQSHSFKHFIPPAVRYKHDCTCLSHELQFRMWGFFLESVLWTCQVRQLNTKQLPLHAFKWKQKKSLIMKFARWHTDHLGHDTEFHTTPERLFAYYSCTSH